MYLHPTHASPALGMRDGGAIPGRGGLSPLQLQSRHRPQTHVCFSFAGWNTIKFWTIYKYTLANVVYADMVFKPIFRCIEPIRHLLSNKHFSYGPKNHQKKIKAQRTKKEDTKI